MEGNERFEAAYARMMESALNGSSEERKSRLLAHDQAEKTMLANACWPAVRNLDAVHPEYEMLDLKGGTRLRFALDDMKEKPHRCRQTLLMGLAKWGGIARTADAELAFLERGMVHLLAETRGELSPSDAARKSGIHERTARKIFGTLERRESLDRPSRYPAGKCAIG